VTTTTTTLPVDLCAGYVGRGTAREIAATPRADVNLEMLALSMTSGLTASQLVYERVVRDVGAIRSAYPAVASIGYFPVHDHQSVIVGFDPPTAADVAEGNYTAWDCANTWYGLQSLNVRASLTQVNLKGIYATPQLATEYGGLPGVRSAEPNYFGGDGPTICGTIDGDTYHYVFDEASGDCPAGCIDHVYSYFTTDAAGSITIRDTWDNSSGAPAPI
jgi:hypothetical protein